MTELIQRELFQLAVMFYAGLAVMLLFEGREQLVCRCGKYKRLAVVIYLAGWACAGYVFYQFAYRACHGVLTVYGLCAFAAGIFLWKKIICGILKKK